MNTGLYQQEPEYPLARICRVQVERAIDMGMRAGLDTEDVLRIILDTVRDVLQENARDIDRTTAMTVAVETIFETLKAIHCTNLGLTIDITSQR